MRTIAASLAVTMAAFFLTPSEAIDFKLKSHVSSRGADRLQFMRLIFPDREACATFYMDAANDPATNCTITDACSKTSMTYMVSKAPQSCTVSVKRDPKHLPATSFLSSTFASGGYQERFFNIEPTKSMFVMKTSTYGTDTGRSMISLNYKFKEACVNDFVKLSQTSCKVISACTADALSIKLVQEKNPGSDEMGLCYINSISDMSFVSVNVDAHTTYNLLESQQTASSEAAEVSESIKEQVTAAPTLLEA
uniref:Uncharacterized protein n=1 Tax=Chromera velia CCMP2878 TaxID=1169474 RepID=A0A0G4F669_9ALVE|eukprot:Cvel_2774.t1-p1 / transcript=Cvel_2774.t1 / gene=Cvel_2774 / organism=Chromera_velia_CCMP2878 / gene_product=hypothetical protein / transcript_product=hypothetical protein / location=Cvel_scaffold111:103426-104175(+) / protein_length=250 / sequence_SO=supercontig / SO=protein_coding / is_pseudo=false